MQEATSVKNIMQGKIDIAPGFTPLRHSPVHESKPAAVNVRQYKSVYQDMSLFTTRVWWKDGNKRTWHSNEQELRRLVSSKLIIDQSLALRLQKELYKREDVLKYAKVVITYFNPLDIQVYQFKEGKYKEYATFTYGNNDKGSTFLTHIETIMGKQTIYQECKEHGIKNYHYCTNNVPKFVK